MEITDYHAKYYAYELTRRCPSDSLEKLISTLVDAQVDLNPHQIDAALFAFRSPFSKGVILADEVGLGKTIEAGIVLSQRWAERKRRILIIVPSSLRKQWNQELLEKFFISSLILETKNFNKSTKDGNANPFLQDKIVICSYHFARNKEEYIRSIMWDLVVIDEAHRLRNVYKKSNIIARTIKESIHDTPKLLLTATPLQNSLLELYGLTSVVDEHIFGDLKSFKSQFIHLNDDNLYDDLRSRLSLVCKRTLRRQVTEYINYTNRIALVQEFTPTREEQKLYDYVSEYLRRERLYALPSSQRQLITLILRKLLASSTFAIAKTLYSLINRLKAMIKEAEKENYSMSATADLPTARDDVLSEDYEAFDQTKDEWQGELGIQQDKKLTQDDIKAIKNEIIDLEKFHNLAESITYNAKGNVLMTALKAGFAKARELGSEEKVLIFTESRRTQEYLFNLLSQTEYENKIVLFNGTNSDERSKSIYQNWLEEHKGADIITGSKSADTRAALVDYFKNQASIMIATESAAEGMNLQFCSFVVNYDLPWNPQRIEQRIGRCHRYGQKHDVVVVNFLNKNNEADQRVYQLLDEKFKLFSGIFGASDEVLGAIESGVDFERRIALIYQQCRTPEEIQRSFNDLQGELEEQISDRMRSTRQQLLEHFDEEVHEKLKVHMEASKGYLNKYESLLWILTKHYLKDYADFAPDEYSFMLKDNPFSDLNLSLGPYKLAKNVEDSHIYRIGHPIAQRILNTARGKQLPRAEIVFDHTNSQSKISILEPLVGQQGQLAVYILSIKTEVQIEDYIIFVGVTDNMQFLDEDHCKRFFSLPAVIADNSSILSLTDALETEYTNKEKTILERISLRDSNFFDEEMDKLDKWTEDVKNSMEIQLKELSKEIKFRKTEAKKIPKLEEKVKAQRHIKELEKKRNTMRMNLYQQQDDVDNKKEQLIEEIESRLKQRIETTELFAIRWKVI
jgi:ERCC4-related helicase